MIEINTSETVFPFVCSNPDCDTSYSIDEFADIYLLWGYIFLTSGDKCIVGLTCPECKYTSIKSCSALPSVFSVNKIYSIATNGKGMNPIQQPPACYVRFPQSLIPAIQNKTIVENSNQEDLYTLPSDFTPIGINPDIEQKTINISADSINALLEIENTQDLKVFPRIINSQSVYSFSDVWLTHPNLEEIPPPEFLEKCHNSLELLYTTGYKIKHDPIFNWNQKHYEQLVLNDLTGDEFQDMDKDLYAWDTDIFRTKINQLLTDYQKLRNRKDFELICYDELINKYAKIFYYQKGLKQNRDFLFQAEYEEIAHIEPPEDREENSYDEDYWADQKVESSENSKPSIEKSDNNMSAVQKFWFERLKRGTFSKTEPEWGTHIYFEILFNKYKAFAQYYNEGGDITSSQFSRQIGKICGGIRTTRSSFKGKRYTLKVFPPLDECRKEFEKSLDMEGQIDWGVN